MCGISFTWFSIGFISYTLASSAATKHIFCNTGSICRQDIVQDRPLNDVANSEAPLQEHSVSKRSTANVVDIAQFEGSSTPGKQFSVYVDETMTRLMIEVKVDRSNPVMMLTKPTGVPGARPSLNTTTGTTFRIATVDIAITSADYGIWKIMKMDANKWQMNIQGESPLDFTYQFLEGTFIQMPITGYPIQGKSYMATMQVQEYSKIQKIDMVFMFVIAKSTPANMFPAKGLGSGKYSVDNMTMIDQEFMIGIQGKDNSGNLFRRLSSIIKPVTLSLSVPSYAGVKLYENTQLDIEFWVVNELSTDQDIDVIIVETKKWAQAPIFISATLTPGQNFSGKFVIKAGAPGETTVATITARQYLGHGEGFPLGPSEVRQFTVERNDTTTTSTSTSTSTTSVTQTTTTPTTITTSSSSRGISSTSAATKKSTVSSVASLGSTSGVISGHSSPRSSTAKVLSLGSTVSTAGRASTSQTSTTFSGPIVSSATAKTPVTGSNATNSLSTGTTTSSSTVVTGSLIVRLAKTASSPKAGITVNTPKQTVKPSASSSGVGKSSTISSTSNAKGGNHGVATHSSASASPVTVAKTAGRTTTGAEANEESGDSFNKGGVFAAAIGSGIGAGVLIGVAALVTMGLILKGGMKGKGAVSPHDQKKKTLEDFNRKQRTLSEHNKLAWT